MTAQPVEAAVPSEDLAVEVELTVTHRVTVRIDGNSAQTLEQMKAAALTLYNKAGTNFDGRDTTNDQRWRARFDGQKVSVGAEQVSIGSVRTRPIAEGRTWAR